MVAAIMVSANSAVWKALNESIAADEVTVLIEESGSNKAVLAESIPDKAAVLEAPSVKAVLREIILRNLLLGRTRR